MERRTDIVGGTAIGWRFAVVLVTMTAVLGDAPAVADPDQDAARQDKERIDQQVAQAAATYEAATRRAREAAMAYAAATSRLPIAQHQLAVARGQLAAAKVAAASARRRATAADRALAAATVAYQQSQRRVEQARAEVGNLVAAARRGHGIVAFSAVFDAGSPTDFADRIFYLNQSAGAMRESLRQVTIARQHARMVQNAAVFAKRRADAARADADRLLVAAQAAERRATTAANLVNALIAQRQHALAVAREEEAESERRYRELQAESARIAAQLRQHAARDRTAARPSPGNAPLLTPVKGWKSSNFGMRYHPIYHRWRLHSGMDIAASGGSPIRAAADGVVIRAGWNGGYGKYTCIYHGRYQGEAIATCYAHQSAILVATGQRVRRGQLVGRVGTTGSSTGNHLHFEVRRDGEPVDPRPYLPSCLC